MEILKTNLTSEREHNTKETFSSIIDEIFIICQNDKKIFNHEKLHDIEARINELKDKEKQKDNLLIEAKKIEDSLDKKLIEDNTYINRSKEKLLEKLGSEAW